MGGCTQMQGGTPALQSTARAHSGPICGSSDKGKKHVARKQVLIFCQVGAGGDLVCGPASLPVQYICCPTSAALPPRKYWTVIRGAVTAN